MNRKAIQAVWRALFGPDRTFGNAAGSDRLGRRWRPAVRLRSGRRESRVPAVPGNPAALLYGIRDALAGSRPNPVRPIEALAVMAIIGADVTSSQTRTAVRCR